ncbi:beta-galactosidase [Arthrobacter agilis]|uniref:beta-galactosidase n=1 Tax=Arthrobacter agilis TaxID=37921 RepID=UPI002365EC43|nr:beta-galactosidase [Arthrobacter agilis]WDF32560.1 beta-galactosidase [Arthrobacter agilis]
MARTTTVAGLSGTGQLVYGCDYNPEQWDRSVWDEDVRLMKEAGVNLVAVNIFGWAEIEPHQGTFRFDDLDAVMDLLSANGIGVNLGTGTSSPPAWLTTAHPEVLPQTADGTTRWPGGRQAFCPSSPIYRERALALVEQVSARYGTHPALRLWHVSNELGCHNSLCYCEVSAASFRRWLWSRYGTLDALNAAWGTAFWSQRYSAWEQILPPRLTLSATNPTQTLDFNRFSSDELLAHYSAEEAVLRRNSDVPVTTNFMVAAHIRNQDYWAWAPEMDVIANDHYVDHRLETPLAELAFAADTTRGLAQGQPWLLMEHSTGAVNWQPRNIAKGPGEMLRTSLTHLARGADGLCFFQWRASLQGSEKFHSAMLPHAGTDSQTWRDVVGLGAALGRLGELAGTTVHADVALVFSWEAWWAHDQESHPSGDVRYIEQVHAAYTALWEAGLTVDVVAPGADLSAYRLVVVPNLYLIRDEHAAVITDFVRNGGSAFVTFFSGIVDENERVRPGGYPGAFLDLLGIRSEEFFPLHRAHPLTLDNGSPASLWSETLRLTTAETVLRFATGPHSGAPAVTRNRVGSGEAWYTGTVLDGGVLKDLLLRAAAAAGVRLPEAQSGLECVTRRGAGHDYIFLINHSTEDRKHRVSGMELLTAEAVADVVVIPGGAVRVVRTPAHPDTDGSSQGRKDAGNDRH